MATRVNGMKEKGSCKEQVFKALVDGDPIGRFFGRVI